MTRIQIPRAFREIFDPYRYIAIHGGRGSAKSHTVAAALVIQAATARKLILGAREIQKSISDSVKLLIENKIKDQGLSDFFRSTKTEIRGVNGSRFIFAGLRTNPDMVKSTEGIDIAWIEEASRVSARSIEILEPTIRKPGSQIIATWNPENETDPIDVMFRGKDGPPPGALVKQVNFTDNPFFPEVLKAKLEWDKKRDLDRYLHIWEGGYRRNSEARVFKNWKVEEFETPPDARFYHGADWGFSVDPSVLVRCFIDGRTLYIDAEAFAVGCEIDHLPALFAGNDPREPRKWSNPKGYPGIATAIKWPIRADSSRPDTVSYMRRRGFNITSAAKGPGSVEDGVEFLQSYDIVVHPRCKNVIDELTYYSWKIDEQTQEILPVLEDKKNHTIDSLRYALEEVRRGRRRATGGMPHPGGDKRRDPFIVDVHEGLGDEE